MNRTGKGEREGREKRQEERRGTRPRISHEIHSSSLASEQKQKTGTRRKSGLTLFARVQRDRDRGIRTSRVLDSGFLHPVAAQKEAMAFPVVLSRRHVDSSVKDGRQRDPHRTHRGTCGPCIRRQLTMYKGKEKRTAVTR